MAAIKSAAITLLGDIGYLFQEYAKWCLSGLMWIMCVSVFLFGCFLCAGPVILCIWWQRDVYFKSLLEEEQFPRLERDPKMTPHYSVP